MSVPQKWSPCYKCNEIELGCHSTCVRYFAFKMSLEDIKLEMAKNDTYVSGYNPNHISRKLSNSSHIK